MIGRGDINQFYVVNGTTADRSHWDMQKERKYQMVGTVGHAEARYGGGDGYSIGRGCDERSIVHCVKEMLGMSKGMEHPVLQNIVEGKIKG